MPTIQLSNMYSWFGIDLAQAVLCAHRRVARQPRFASVSRNHEPDRGKRTTVQPENNSPNVRRSSEGHHRGAMRSITKVLPSFSAHYRVGNLNLMIPAKTTSLEAAARLTFVRSLGNRSRPRCDA